MQFDIVFTIASLTLLGLLPMVNPPMSATLLLGLSKGKNKQYIQTQAKAASFYLFLALTTTFFIGASILDAFSISMPSLRLGGGLVIGAIGFNMLFPKLVLTPDLLEDTQDSIAFVPLTIPSMCGPGTMALIISGTAGLTTMPEDVSQATIYSGVLLGFLAMSLIAWAVLSMAYPMLKLLGKNGIDAFSRIMGFLLVCMGTQFCVNGITEIYHSLSEIVV